MKHIKTCKTCKKFFHTKVHQYLDEEREQNITLLQLHNLLINHKHLADSSKRCDQITINSVCHGCQ